MPRIDLRINLSFKNNEHEVDMYNFVKEKGSIIGDSAYLKILIDKAMREEKESNK